MQPTILSSSDNLMMTTSRPDSPGVRIPPAGSYVVAFLIGLALQSRFPLPFLPRPVALSLGAILVATFALLVSAAIPTMLRGRGTLNTTAPSAALVTSGLYRFSRNPMYLGMFLLYAGCTCLISVVWALPLLIPLALYIYFGVIASEERYLERAFGGTYRAYKARVRRWL